MDIQYAILGYLNWRSLSGYDLKKLISDSELFYWSGNNNQIYNSLIHLHKEGLVSPQVEYQENLPAKKIYSITAEGRARLRQWQATAPELPEYHNPFLIQLAWSDLLSDDEVDGLLVRYAGEIEVQLRMRQAEARSLTATTAPQRTPREAYLWRRIHENRIAAYQHELDWVRQVQAELKDQSV